MTWNELIDSKGNSKEISLMNRVAPGARWIRRHLNVMLLFLVVGLLVPDSSLKAAAQEKAAILTEKEYTSSAAAQAAWAPMSGSKPVQVETIMGIEALGMSCNFAGTKIERASWDRAIQLDLVSCRGIQFKLFCRDTFPVSYFSIYFQSGEGWYQAAFFPEQTNAWNTITIDKAAMALEGKPGGWDRIRTIRISAWRGQDRDTDFAISDLRKTGMLGVEAMIAIIRGESASQRGPEEARSVKQFTETVADDLRALQLEGAVLSDLDVTQERLKQATLVILPYNPQMPDRVENELIQYAQNGGKILAFYTLPSKLLSALKLQGGPHVREPRPKFFSTIRFATNALPGAPPVVAQQSWNISAIKPAQDSSQVLAEWHDEKGQPTGYGAIAGSTNGLVMTHVLLTDDRNNKRRMLLAMAGYLVPEIWHQAAAQAIARAGNLGEYGSYDAAEAQLRRLGAWNPQVDSVLAEGRLQRELALKLVSEKRYPEAMDRAAMAEQRLQEAYCRAQQPEPGEFRAFWCHSAFGVEGMEWEEAIRGLAKNGFTAILPNMLWGGAAFYPSAVLPVATAVAQRGDQVAQCLEACRKFKIQVHVWKVNWNLGRAAPKEFIDRMRSEGRLQASSSGKEEPWLCPSHPDNQELEIASMVEVARNYEVDGIHFDYIRYPDSDHCYCAGCKERFQKACGTTLTQWPKDGSKESPLYGQWLEWRRGHITRVVKAVSEQARAVRPGIKISAAVFPNWSSERDSIGQDWKLWCEKGYLDFVCPMDYTPSNRNFENRVMQQVQWAGRIPCYPGIGVSASSSRFGADRTIEQINITRRLQTHGFVIFNYGVEENRELLPLLGLGITSKQPGSIGGK